MQPNPLFINIPTSFALVEKFIHDVILTPRLKSLEWSKITKQTPGLKIGYPAQHIASLLTGVEGRRSAARGDDLADGSEVKGCNRVDQLDTCLCCSNKVLRHELKCVFCGSSSINRKDDSKWLLTIRSESELKLYTEKIDRIILILLDYPNFTDNDFNSLSIKAYEIWPKKNYSFKKILEDYYYKIYIEHINKNPSKTPAPKNLWPYSFQFYKCKPIKIYECLINNINTQPNISTLTYIDPKADRSFLLPEAVPTKILDPREFEMIFNCFSSEFESNDSTFFSYWKSLTPTQKKTKAIKEHLYKKYPYLPHYYLDCIDLRETSKAIEHVNKYFRR